MNFHLFENLKIKHSQKFLEEKLSMLLRLINGAG